MSFELSASRFLFSQAEAERSRRAKVIHAKGEEEASLMLAQAAKNLASEEQALQLRYLQTLTEIAGENTNTIVFPLPIDLVRPLLQLSKSITAEDSKSKSD